MTIRMILTICVVVVCLSARTRCRPHFNHHHRHRSISHALHRRSSSAGQPSQPGPTKAQDEDLVLLNANAIWEDFVRRTVQEENQEAQELILNDDLEADCGGDEDVLVPTPPPDQPIPPTTITQPDKKIVYSPNDDQQPPKNTTPPSPSSDKTAQEAQRKSEQDRIADAEKAKKKEELDKLEEQRKTDEAAAAAAAQRAQQEKEDQAKKQEQQRKADEEAAKKEQERIAEAEKNGKKDSDHITPPVPTSPDKKDPAPAPDKNSDGYGGDHLKDDYSGDATFYATGQNACGHVDKDEDMICAVSKLLYDSFPASDPGNPNTNSVCGRRIRAHYDGHEVIVKVTDRCEGCALRSLDFSPAAFALLGKKEEGRLHGMTWSFI